MSKSIEEIVEIYERLLDYFYSGVLALIVFRTLQEELQDARQTKDSGFIVTLYLSTYNTIVLALANTANPHEDSISLHYLLNCIVNSRHAFDRDTYTQLVAFIKKFNSALENENVVIQAAVRLRDTLVAHLDRRHVTNPTALSIDPPVPWTDFQRTFETIGSGLHELGTIMHRPDVSGYLTISNFFLAQQTREVFRNLCAVNPRQSPQSEQGNPAQTAG